MAEVISIERDGAQAARSAFEECVMDGGVVVFPADTVYGLACDPLNKSAVKKIHRLKGRDEGKSSAVMYFSPLAVRELVERMGPATRDAVGVLLSGPVTLVIANPERRYPLACSEDERRLGLRLIGGPLAGAMHPVFQTSANRAGEPAPARFEDVREQIVAGADLAIDGGEVGGWPSTVIDLTGIDSGTGVKVLREGAMPVGEVERRLAALDARG